MTSCFCFSVFLFYFEVLPSRVTCCCSFPPSVWICRPPSSLSTCVLFVISPCVCVSVSPVFHLCLTCYSPVLFPEPPSVSLWYVSCFLVVFRSWLCISVCSRLNWLVFCSCLVLCFSFCAVTLYFWHLALGFWIIYIYIFHFDCLLKLPCILHLCPHKCPLLQEPILSELFYKISCLNVFTALMCVKIKSSRFYLTWGFALQELVCNLFNVISCILSGPGFCNDILNFDLQTLTTVTDFYHFNLHQPIWKSGNLHGMWTCYETFCTNIVEKQHTPKALTRCWSLKSEKGVAHSGSICGLL